MSGRAGAATRTEPVCGTPIGYDRHRRRGEPVDDACRDARNAYQRDRRAEGLNARRAMRAAKAARENEQAITAGRQRRREHRVIHLPSGSVALGALAGTTTAHRSVPDGHTASCCQLCFGWSDDYRHWPTGGTP